MVAPPAAARSHDLEDLPGLKDQAEQLIELLDLGFHHGEVTVRDPDWWAADQGLADEFGI